MSDRREGPRFITEMPAGLRTVKDGKSIDDRATAHDVSLKGFKIETQAQLAENSRLAFTLELPGGEKASGVGRVVWMNKEAWATWAGVEIEKMPWGDKRRLANLLSPDRVDWARISGSATKLLFALVVVTAAHRLLRSPSAREVLYELTPKIVALTLMGWSLVNLLKREKR